MDNPIPKPKVRRMVGPKSKKFNPLKRIDMMYKDCLMVLEREVYQLVDLSREYKLDPIPAKDLRDYIKVLREMKEAHEAIEAKKVSEAEAKKKAMSEEELVKALREGVNK